MKLHCKKLRANSPDGFHCWISTIIIAALSVLVFLPASMQMATDAIAQSERQESIGTALDDKLDLDLGDVLVPSVTKSGLQVEAGSFYDEEPPDMGGSIGEDPIGEYSGLRFSLPLKE